MVDVGCGAGAGPIAVAQAFPNADVHGYDNSVFALKLAEENKARAGVANVTFHNPERDPLPASPTFDFVMALDCLHDMTQPAAVAASVRRAIRDDGTWLIREIRSSGSWTEDQRNPMLAMMYGFSVASCMSSALSEPGGAGLGTLGLPPPALEALCHAAGFAHVAVHDLDDPTNLFYEVRV